MTRSRSSGASSNHRFITLENCAKGDLVFVVWSMRHGQFMVVQDSLTLYFVHADSLAALQLTAPPSAAPPSSLVLNEQPLAVIELNQIPLPYYAIGRVIDKEYCQARKVSSSTICCKLNSANYLTNPCRMKTVIASAKDPSSIASNWRHWPQEIRCVASDWNVSE